MRQRHAEKKPDLSSLLQRIKSMVDVLFTMIDLFLFYQVRIRHTRNYVFKTRFIFKHFVSVSVHQLCNHTNYLFWSDTTIE